MRRGSYVYFEDAPDDAALQTELRRIFHALYNVNLKRTDRMTMVRTHAHKTLIV